jgi:putative transposase
LPRPLPNLYTIVTMGYDPKIHHRQSIRLKEFDYSQSGAYFLTCVTHNRSNLFGKIENNIVQLNQYGELVRMEWLRLPQRFPGIDIDEFVIMPNHIHGIVIIADHKAGWNLATIVGSFKSSTARMINAIRKSIGGLIWQRNYYEHVIRDDEELNRVREYIQNNPLNWMQDEEYRKVN